MEEDKSKKKNNDVKVIAKKYKKIAIVVVALSIIMFLGYFLLPKKPGGGIYIFQKDDAITIGEKKYLQFLWMVDGAFNNERYKEEYTVNERKMDNVDKKFTCTYQEGSKKCIGNNFEEEFKKIFSNKITYNKVYGDGQAFYWYEKLDGKYQFNNINTCNASRMNTLQKLELVEEKSDKLTYTVTFEDNVKSGIYKGNNEYKRNFVLIKEDGEWKVSEAYYHDPCYMDYYIE